MKINLSISPQRISWISLALSIVTFFMLRIDISYGIVWMLIVIVVDMGDGMLFRRRKLSKIDGLGIEVSHRLSEFLIFYPSRIWILLTAINVYLTIANLKDKKLMAMPLRHAFLLVLVMNAIGVLPESLFFLL